MNENQEPLDYYRHYSDFSVNSDNKAIGVAYVGASLKCALMKLVANNRRSYHTMEADV